MLIQRTDRLGDIVTALQGRAGDISVLPVHPRAGEPAKRVIVRAVKGSRAPLRLLSGLVVHGSDGERFTAESSAIFCGETRFDMMRAVQGRRP